MATKAGPVFKPEDYSRFLIREFLKKNNFPKTYDSFIAEDTREKVTMTKNQLTNLLGIEALMKRNSKNKTFSTMLDIICDFLMLSKEATNGAGVQIPKPGDSIKITQSSFQSPSTLNDYNNIPRPQTSMPKTQTSFYPNQALQSKPVPMMNAFQSGSNADISLQNIEINQAVLNK